MEKGGSGFGGFEDFEKWIEEKYEKDLWEDFKGNTLYSKESGCYKKALRKFKKEKYEKTSYIYLTLSPDKQLRNLDVNDVNIDNLKKWATNWFEYNPKFYGDYKWVLESGSKNDHLHIHAVAEMKSSHKHAEKLKKSWAKTFPNNQLITTLNIKLTYSCANCKANKCRNPKHRGEYAYLSFDDKQILKDKLEYFENEKKSSHENLVDLKVSGSRGVLS